MNVILILRSKDKSHCEIGELGHHLSIHCGKKNTHRQKRPVSIKYQIFLGGTCGPNTGGYSNHWGVNCKIVNLMDKLHLQTTNICISHTTVSTHACLPTKTTPHPKYLPSKRQQREKKRRPLTGNNNQQPCMRIYINSKSESSVDTCGVKCPAGGHLWDKLEAGASSQFWVRKKDLLCDGKHCCGLCRVEKSRKPGLPKYISHNVEQLIQTIISDLNFTSHE